MLAHLGERDVHVVRPGQVAGGADEGVPLRVEHVEDAGDRDENVVLADHGLRVGLPVAAAVPVPEPVPATAAAVVVVVVARGPAAGRHRLPVAAALVPAALIPAALVTAALIAAAVVTVALVTAGLVAAALVTVALIAAALSRPPLSRLLPSRLPLSRLSRLSRAIWSRPGWSRAWSRPRDGLVLPAPVPAPPVTALHLARRALVPRTRLAVLAGARRRASRPGGCLAGPGPGGAAC